VFAGGFQDCLRAIDVVLRDFGWLFDARTDSGLGGLMVDYVDVFDELVDEGFVSGQALDKLVAALRDCCSLASRIDVAFFQPEVVKRFENVERRDVVAGALENHQNR